MSGICIQCKILINYADTTDLGHLLENPHSGDFYLFPSKAHSILDLLENSPRPFV